MSTFWALTGILMALALLFTVVPLLRKHQLVTVDHDRLNAEVVKEQLNELQADLEAGKLDQQTYAAARHDLERDLLSNLNGGNSDGAAEQNQGRWAAGLVALLVPGLALFIYLQIGMPDYSARAAEARNVAAGGNSVPGAHPLEDMVKVLAQRLRDEPDRLEGWLLLGRSYATLNRYDKAVEAYGQARRIAGDTPELLIDSADMQVMANGGRFTAEVGGLLEIALKGQPDNAKGRWLLGHYHYQHNDPQAAIENWQRAAAALPADSDSLVAINQQIARARSELGETVAAVPTTVAAATNATAPATTGNPAAAGSAIQVSVDLDPDLRAKTSPQDTLFVFARATQGPRMPLAIVRKQVADLPITVTLDDSQAMTPAMVLSNFEEVAIGARISKSGTAMPQSGDLEGLKSPVKVGQDTAIAITIDQRIP